MSKYLVAAAALLAVSACSKPAATPAADSAATAAPAPAPAAPTDTTKKADTTKVAGDTAKRP
jgi:hypothetical protein